MGIFSNKEKTKVEEPSVTTEQSTEQEADNIESTLEMDRQNVYYSFLFSGFNPSTDNILDIKPFNTEFYNYVCERYGIEKFQGYISVTDNKNTNSLLEQTLKYNEHFLVDNINTFESQINLNKAIDWVMISDSTDIDISILPNLYSLSEKGLLFGMRKKDSKAHEIIEFLYENDIKNISLQSAFSENYYSVMALKR